MADDQVIPETTPGEPAASPDEKREQSKIVFPYQDLEEAVAVARAVHQIQGSSCTFDQLAAQLKESPKSSGVRLKLGTAKVFGLVTVTQGTITLTQTGMQMCDPQQEKAARVEAFLIVPLFKAVYEQFRSAILPPPSGLEAAMVTLGVAQKQKERARQVFQRSAQQSGFFQFGTDRLVKPAIKNSVAPDVAPVEPEPENGKKRKERKDDEDDLHPFIQGLLRKLPQPETEWTIDGRAKWLQAAVNIFDLMYTDSDDSRRSINIDFRKDSAK